MVAGTVAWNLMLPSYTLSNQTYCDESSHVHDEETCWSKVLTCGLEESDVTENISTTETSETENNQTPVDTLSSTGDAQYRVSVSNSSGAVLPEAGGSGPTIFLIVGSAVLLGTFAVLVLYEQKRKRI